MPSVTFVALCYFFWSACCYHIAALVAALRAHIDHIIGALYHIDVVLDDDDRVPVGNQLVERLHEGADVVEVQTCGGFVENEESRRFAVVAEVVRLLYALVFTAR